MTGADHQAAAASGIGDVRPAPSEEEVAAIVAAIEAAWPRGVLAEPSQEMPRWRFSGRWWSKPLPARRDRP